jgi:diamine N-acetyltransferase
MLKGENILLRALEPSDVELLYHWENDSSIWQMSNTLTPFSKHVLEQYVANSHLDLYTTRQLRLVINDYKNNKSVGCIDLFDYEPYHKRAGVGVLISCAEDRKKGYAKEALKLLINYTFSYLNFHQLYCNITIDNEASLRLFVQFGFEIIGKKKQWIWDGNDWRDEYILQLLRSH